MSKNDKPEGYVFGRPTKYRPEYCQKIVEFFDRKPYEPMLKDDGTPFLNKFGDPVMIPAVFPTFERFAFEIGVEVKTLHNWCNEHPDFLQAFTRAKHLQSDVLDVNGLAENYNAGYAKFIAINCTEKVDKVETKHSGAIATPVIQDDIEG